MRLLLFGALSGLINTKKDYLFPNQSKKLITIQKTNNIAIIMLLMGQLETKNQYLFAQLQVLVEQKRR